MNAYAIVDKNGKIIESLGSETAIYTTRTEARLKCKDWNDIGVDHPYKVVPVRITIS